MQFNFYQTRMGRVFFEDTLPNLVNQLSRVADALEKQNKENAQATQNKSKVPIKMEDSK